MSLAPLRRLHPVFAPAFVAALFLAACGADTSETPRAAGDSGASATIPSAGGSADEDSAAAATDTSAAVTGASTDTSAAPTAAADSIGFPAGTAVKGQRYNVKSGIIELRSASMGGLTQTVYFDDYGRKEAVYANISSGGQTVRSVMVTADGAHVVYDPVRKTGTRLDVADALSQLGLGGIPNLSSLDANARRELKYQEIPGRTVLGRDTQGASIEVMGTPVRVWTWQGVPLRMEASMQGQELVVEATSLKTDVDVPAGRFAIPSDVKLTEMKGRD